MIAWLVRRFGTAWTIVIVGALIHTGFIVAACPLVIFLAELVLPSNLEGTLMLVVGMILMLIVISRFLIPLAWRLADRLVRRRGPHKG